MAIARPVLRADALAWSKALAAGIGFEISIKA